MSEENQQKSELERLEHVQSPGLRTVHADGVLFSRTSSLGGEGIQLIFYCESVRIKYESLQVADAAKNQYHTTLTNEALTPVREQVGLVSMSRTTAHQLLEMLQRQLGEGKSGGQ